MVTFIKKRAGFCAAALGLLAFAATSLADSGPIRDPTGCATGSAVANCRSLPRMHDGSDSGERLRPSKSQDHSTSDRRRRLSPLPSEGVRDWTSTVLPPSEPTDLGGGSTRIGH